jgi:hypothetical protein
MDSAIIFLFVPLVAVAALLANIGIWSPRRMWLKLSALAAAAVFIPLGYTSLSELMSRPKPVALEWLRRELPEAKLLGASMRENEAIYLWLQVPEVDEPRAYTLPWSRPLAEQLQRAQREAKKNRNGVRVRRPFDGTDDPRKRMFFAAPQQPLPPKPAPDELSLNQTPPRQL